MPLLLVNVIALSLLLVDVRAALSSAYTRLALGRLGALALAGGVLLPLGLLVVGSPLPMLGAGLLIVLAALVVRLEIVHLPHRHRSPE